MIRSPLRRTAGVGFTLCMGIAFASPVAAQRILVLPGNMEVLKCKAPDENYRFLGSSAPGQLYLAGESVKVRLALKKGNDSGAVEFGIEIQEITTRDPEAKIEGGFTDTAGHAPRIGLEGKPIVHPLKVAFDDKPEVEVAVDNLPVPQKFGTYALVLTRGDARQFLATLCRLPEPRADGHLENTPVFGEFALFDREEYYETRAAVYDRMGVRGMRLEIGWNENLDGQRNWDRLDKIFSAVSAKRIQLMVTLGAHPNWSWPFAPNQTPAAVSPTWDGNPYWGQGDWMADEKHYPRYGEWIKAFCQRYWKDGKGSLWGLENFNEPWEGGGISGWASDSVRYRTLQKLIAESARSVDPRIKICAASSIMNTEDKFYADGSREFDKYIDIFTDHYVPPAMCYGPMVAAAHGKQSVETETWLVNSEYLMPQIVQFLAAGQGRLSPWHPRVLFDKLPGNDDEHFIPTPAVAATAAFNYFVTGRPFEKVVFHDHLPWVFQFGKDDDPKALLVVFGSLMPIGSEDPKEILWTQVNNAKGGTMTIDNADGLLSFFDLAGNPQYVGEKSVTVPMSIYPTYVTCSKGAAAAAARLKSAKIDGKRPVEIIPRDFVTRVDAKNAALQVTLHNCLNREISGKLTATSPAGLKLAEQAQPVKLAAGETKTLSFPLAEAKADAANAYAFRFNFESDGGNAEYAEVLNATIIPRGTKTVDGNLDDWADVPGVTVVAGAQQAELTELLRRPWLALKESKPEGNFAEFKLAWDDSFLYVAARVNDKTVENPSPKMEGRDEDAYFHTASSDKASPYKEFLAKYRGRSFAETPHVYRFSPERPLSTDLPWISFRRDRLHLALDVTDDWHDLKPTTDRVPYGFHAVPDTDYEYTLYGTAGGQSELWRLLAPGVPRRHDFPRTLKGEHSTGAVPSAKHVVKREGTAYIYELAIPKAELANLKLQAGTTLGIMLRGGNSDGPHVDFGPEKAATKINGLTLHPYWERCANSNVRWKLVD